MGSEILEHPARGRHGAGPVALDGEALPPVLEGEVEEPAPAPDQESPVLERLHALVRKGYRPEIGADTATDIVVLRHVGRAPDLILHSNGELEGYDGRRPRYKRDVEPPPLFAVGKLSEQLRFMKFLDSVPRATLRDRTRRWRHKYIYFPLVMAILLAIHLAFTAIILDDGGTAPPPAEVSETGGPAAAAAAAEAARVHAAAAAKAEAGHVSGVQAPAGQPGPGASQSAPAPAGR
jgi:hypothetical protein